VCWRYRYSHRQITFLFVVIVVVVVVVAYVAKQMRKFYLFITFTVEISMDAYID